MCCSGSNAKKRRYYSDDLKIAIYQELLAKTDPPVLRHGVSKLIALKFGVPLRLVQCVWRNGQDYGGIEGVRNKYVKNCGRKKVEIDMEAIKDVPLGERKTIKDLANALGVKEHTLRKVIFVGTPSKKAHLKMQGDLPTSSLQRQTVITQLPTKNVNLCCIGIFQKDFQIGVVPYESTDQMKN